MKLNLFFLLINSIFFSIFLSYGSILVIPYAVIIFVIINDIVNKLEDKS